MTAVPNYSGMFLRGYGSQSHTKNNGSQVGNTTTHHVSGQIGVIQGDAARNITGFFRYADSYRYHTFWLDQVFYDSFQNASELPYRTGLENRPNTNDARIQKIHFDASRMIPVANENRPVNIAVRYLIRCR